MNDSLLGRQLKGVPRGTGYWNSVVIFLSNTNDVKNIYIYLTCIKIGVVLIFAQL